MFKNYIIYQLSEELNLNDVEARLESFKSKEPSRTAIESIGFTVPYASHNGFIFSVHSCHYFTVQRFKKNIPAKLVKYRLSHKIIKLMEKGESISKKLKQQLKEEIINDIASVTPAVPEVIRFMYDEVSQAIVVDASSHKKAELCIGLLRKAIGSVPVKPLLSGSIGHILTSWCFEGELPDELELLEKGKLRAHDESKSEASFNHQCMDADEVIAARESGKEIVLIAMHFDEDFSFVFTDEGIIKSIKYSDYKIEQMGEIPKDNESALFDAEMAINAESTRTFIEFLKRHFS